MTILAVAAILTLEQPLRDPRRIEAPPCQGYWLRLTEHVQPDPAGMIFTASIEPGGPARIVVVTADGHTLGVLRGPSAMHWQCRSYQGGAPA